MIQNNMHHALKALSHGAIYLATFNASADLADILTDSSAGNAM